MMSETLQVSWLRKFRDTPWRDLLRGRLTGRFSVVSRIDATGIPQPAKELVQRVIRRTRLWRIEKIAVADELLAHFEDGISTGSSVDQLIRDFGDEHQAAKLIRRAKVRNRPRAWRALGVVIRVVEIAMAGQIILAGYFFFGHPSVTTDYAAQLNAAALQTPQDQQGWPLYCQAKLAMHDDRPPQQFDEIGAMDPGGRAWTWVMQWYDHHAASMELIRQAAAKPSLGFVLGPNGSLNNPAFPESSWMHSAADWPLAYFTSRYPANVWNFHDRVQDDAKVALEEHDRGRFIGDISALLGMADQVGQQGFLATDDMALGFRGSALREFAGGLSTHSELFKDSDLREIAHRLSRIGDAEQMYNLKSERAIFCDLLQRAYTDDGSGNGRLTPEGVRLLLPALGSIPIDYDRNTLFFMGPSKMAISGSRAQELAEFDHMMEVLAMDFRRPLGEFSNDSGFNQFMQDHWGRSAGLNQFRYPILGYFVRDYWYERDPAGDYSWFIRIHAERLLVYRDALEAGLALEAYHRQHGKYPDTLGQLVPGLLPAAPIDPVTGESVRYRLIDGHPIVYSVGADGVDDGGRPPIIDGRPDSEKAMGWWKPIGPLPPSMPKGDWILYPREDLE